MFYKNHILINYWVISIFSYAIDGYLPKEWKLAYMPKNAIFEDLLKRVSLHLGLNEPFSVSNSTEMESVITERRILAGVRFHHEEVYSHLISSLRT